MTFVKIYDADAIQSTFITNWIWYALAKYDCYDVGRPSWGSWNMLIFGGVRRQKVLQESYRAKGRYNAE